MKKINLNKKIFLFLITLIGYTGMKAQTAGATCTTALSVADGTTPVVTFNTNADGWLMHTASAPNPTLILTNSNDNSSYEINTMELYQGSCGSLTLVASDVLSGASDSVLTINASGLTPSQTYYIKLRRTLTTTQNSYFQMEILAPLCGIGYFYNYNAATTPISSTTPPNGFCSVFSTFTNVSVCSLTTCCTNSFSLIKTFYNPSFNSYSNGFGPYYYIVYASGGNPTYTVTNSSTNYTVTTIPFIYGPGVTYTINDWNNTAFPTFTDQPQGVYGCYNLEVTPLCELPGSYTLDSPVCVGAQSCFVFTTTPNPQPNSQMLISYSQGTINAPYQPLISSTGPPFTYFACQTYSAAGTYTGQYTTQWGIFSQAQCVVVHTLTTIVSPASGTIAASASPSFICSGQNSTLTASASGITTYTWLTGTSTLTGNPIVVSPTVNTTYTIIGGSCPQRTAYVTVNAGNCCINPGIGNISFNNITLVPFGTGGATAWTSLVANSYYTNINIAIPSSGIISGNFSVNGFLTLTANVTFNNTNIYFGENAVVNQNATVTLNRSYWHGCDKNWRGIISNRMLTVSNSVIEDAQKAIDAVGTNSSTPHMGLFVDNTIFNINSTGIVLRGVNFNDYRVTGCIFTTRAIPVANYVYTSGSRWTSLPNFSNASLAAYNMGYMKGSAILSIQNTERGQMGIWHNFASNLITGANPTGDLKVGDASITPTLNAQYTNVFDNLRIGIISMGSKNAIYNNFFQYINYQPATDFSTASACFYNTQNRSKVGWSVNGAAAVPYANKFTNSLNGVYGTSNGTLTLSNNLFSSVTQHGVWLDNWQQSAANTTTLAVTNNTFTTCLYDLYASANFSINLNFSNNISTYPFIVTKAKVTYHAYIFEYAKPTTAKYNLGFNQSAGKVNGIYCINLYAPTASNNTITVRTPIGAGFNAPIWLDNNEQGVIQSNKLNVSPINNQSYNTFGIFTNVGTNNLYCDNAILGAGSAMKFQGNSPSRIWKNNLNSDPSNPCIFGIFLDNNGFVGPIKYNSACAENVFGDFTNGDTYTQNGSSGSPIDYPLPYANSNPLCPFTNANNPVPPSPPFTLVVNNTINHASCISGQQMMAMSGSSSGAGSSTLSAGIPVIMNNELAGGNNAAKAIANKSTFEMARKAKVNVSTIAGGSAFMNAQLNGSSGSFYKSDSLVQLYLVNGSNATLNQAKSLNAGVNATNTPETNQKSFNVIYFDYVLNQGVLTNSQINSLKALAALCPFTDGTSVYQARAMVKRFDTTEFFNACEYSQPQNSSNRLMNTVTDLNSGKEALSTLVFPNPASTELTVTTDLDGAKLLIFNIVGQLVIESEINSITKINVSEFKNGTYIYKIVKDDKIIKADKLIISK